MSWLFQVFPDRRNPACNDAVHTCCRAPTHPIRHLQAAALVCYEVGEVGQGEAVPEVEQRHDVWSLSSWRERGMKEKRLETTGCIKVVKYTTSSEASEKTTSCFHQLTDTNTLSPQTDGAAGYLRLEMWRLCFDHRVFIYLYASYSHNSKSIKPNRITFGAMIGYYPGTIWLDFGIDRVKGQCQGHEKVNIFSLP